MHRAELTPIEQRVLGCLIEKRWTTPDQYPLSINALRLACNQSTNRDPVTDYDESSVRAAAERLSRYGLARLASGAGSRATKYRHLAEEGLGLDRDQLAVLCVLLLRGPQTPGELKARSDRMAHLATLADVDRVLAELASHGYVERLERRPGLKEDRYRHLLGEVGDGVAAAPPAVAQPAAQMAAAAPPVAQMAAAPPHGPEPAAQMAPGPLAPGPQTDSLADRVAALEAEVARLRELEETVGSLRRQLADLLD
ncbi:MAG: YceH family protein [Solirubrobacteraceae bacterium]